MYLNAKETKNIDYVATRMIRISFCILEKRDTIHVDRRELYMRHDRTGNMASVKEQFIFVFGNFCFFIVYFFLFIFMAAMLQFRKK